MYNMLNKLLAALDEAIEKSYRKSVNIEDAYDFIMKSSYNHDDGLWKTQSY